MERFSISILRQQVYNICRLCGVDNPDKTSILGDENVICIMESDEPTLARKIEECVGIQVFANDQMPQNICSLCVDKVNDFYEYRLMCASTNIQTRTFLNLPIVQPSVSLIKPELGPSTAELHDDKSLATISTSKHGPKTRNRKKQLGTDVSDNGEDADIKSIPDAPSEKRFKLEYSCQYCSERYEQPTDLDRHLVVKHTPLIHKFGCGSCMEYFDTASEYKDHNLWHKLTRTAFGCFRCGKKCVKIGTLNKHVAINACIKRPRTSSEVTLVPDMRCAMCQKVFKTRNLYEWHGCFMRAKANCPKCGKYFLKKNLLIRHYMLYCTGTLSLIEPTFIPKDEPGIGPAANGLQDNLARGSTAVKRGRGRPPARATEKMKEETVDLPFPSLLDLPDFKSESNSGVEGHFSSEETLSNVEANEAHKRSSLVKETDKITTLLRSGASVDGNTDIATINSMLSSVNEAIATISKVRKKKRKRDRLHASGVDQPAGEGSEKAVPPMVVLSMANVKQEVHEEQNMFSSLTNSASEENEVNAPATMQDSHQEEPSVSAGGEMDHNAEQCDSDAGDNVGDNFADHNDSGGDSSDVEVTSIENFLPTAGTNSSATRTEPLQSMQPMVQVKQEPMVSDDGGQEPDFEGYEDVSMYVAVKQEPSDEPVATESNQPCYAMEKHADTTAASSYQALRIKIKKEKGLLNATVVENDADPIRTPVVSSEVHNKRSSSGTKATKSAVKRNNTHPSAKRHRQPSVDMSVTIKQEPLESDEQPEVNVATEQYCSSSATLFDGTVVRIKQEPLDDNTRPGSSEVSIPTSNETPCPFTDIVAFDGTRIKQERVGNDAQQQQITQASNKPDLASKKAFNPLSLTGVRLTGSKKSSAAFVNSSRQPSASVHKSSVLINPFALLKQKECMPTVEGQESVSKETDAAASGSERFSLPVITQVKSIDPVEHLSLASVATVEAEKSSPEVGQLQTETSTTTWMDNAGEDTADLRNRDCSPSDERVAHSDPVTSNASPTVSTSELKIASVTTITENVYGFNSQEPCTEEQHISVEESKNSEDGVTLAAVSEPDGTNEPSSSELAEKDLLPTLDSQDDERREAEEEPQSLAKEQETSVDQAAVSELSVEPFEDNAVAVRVDDEQQEHKNGEIVPSKVADNIDTVAASSIIETSAVPTSTEDEQDVNINASPTTVEHEQVAAESLAVKADS